jgi:hypothetical protein
MNANTNNTTVRNIVKAQKAAEQSRMAEFFDARELAVRTATPKGTTGSTTRAKKNEARHMVEAALQAKWAAEHDVTIIPNRLSVMAAVELVPEVGTEDFFGTEVVAMKYTEAQPGFVQSKLMADDRFIRGTEVSKHMIGQFVPGLEKDTLVVFISHTTADGKELSIDQKSQILRRFCSATKRVPLWTQSSVKDAMFYTVSIDMHAKLVKRYGLKDGRKAANTLGLLFSDIDSRPLFSFRKHVVAGDPTHDGNVTTEPALIGGFTCQFRGIALEEVNGEWELVALAKGTLTPLIGAGTPNLDTNTVKFAGMEEGHEYTFVIGTQENVSALRQGKGYISWEGPIFLNDTPEVRKELTERVYREVKSLMDLMKPEHRAELSDRMGGMEFTNYDLNASRTVAVELLNANIEWCDLIEKALHRFLIQLLVNHLIPSAGIKVRSTIFTGWSGAQSTLEGDERNKGTRMITGAPLCSPNDFMFYLKDPFKDNQGCVVNGIDLAARKRDTDGDRSNKMIGDNEKDTLKLVDLFARNLNMDIKVDRPADKARKEMGHSQHDMISLAIDIMASAYIVGAATTAASLYIEAAQQHKSDAAEYAHCCDLAAKFEWAAMSAPVLAKYDISLKGVEFKLWVSRLFGATKKERATMSLQWHDMADAAAEFSSPRELAEREVNGEMTNSFIKEPKSLLDFVWNSGMQAVKDWHVSTPELPISTSDLEGIIIDKRGLIPGWALQAAFDIASEWAGYWADGDGIDENGERISFRTKQADAEMRLNIKNQIKACDIRVVDALLTSRAKNAATLAKLVAQSGRLVEAIGLHPQVEAYIRVKYPKMAEKMGLKPVESK